MTSPNDVVLGLGGTVDYEITWDAGVLEELVERYGIVEGEISAAAAVETERDLVRSILGFLRAGEGGERFVASSALIERFAERFDRRITVGGTCVRAALALDVLGVPSTVHLVSIDDHVRRLLPERVSFVCSAVADSTDPHLVVQFPEGAHIRRGDLDLRAPAANRLIYVNDPPNRELVLSPALGDVLASARLVLVSGLNTVQDPDTLGARLIDLRRHVDRLPHGALVVFEDAGYHVPQMAGLVRDALVGRVDVWSMNEDEMQAYLGHQLDLGDPEVVARAVCGLRELVPARVLVVHTRYWAVAVGDGARRWEPALAGGVEMASARYLHGDGLTAEQVQAVECRPLHPTGLAMAQALRQSLHEDVACVPARVLVTPTPTTIGLGDSFVGGLLGALSTVAGAGAEAAVRPYVLPANQPPDRFYSGGRQIATFRQEAFGGGNVPEDWVASTTPLFGEPRIGLSTLPDGQLLLEAVRRDPVSWLGRGHVELLGADTCLLVKLLDAGQRLPVHAHPDVTFAQEYLALTHGKTEAWVFLRPARVHLGFSRDVSSEELARWVRTQDARSMLTAMHEIEVEEGDAVLVPAGVPHAIGEGALLVELQELTDLSVLLEWEGFAIDGASAGHLGLGFGTALVAVDRRAWSPDQVTALREARAADEGDLLPGAARFFRVQRHRGATGWTASFAVLVVVSGEGVLQSEQDGGGPLRVGAGSTVVIPHAAGDIRWSAPSGTEVLLCLPPSPRRP